jgi:adenosylmethionine-8-amino-7-oxononanoate aminotransferase
VQTDQRFHLHPLLGDDVSDRVIAPGRGCRLADTAGRDYLDATGGLWLALVISPSPVLTRSEADRTVDALESVRGESSRPVS